jgi:hypothetical protein
MMHDTGVVACMLAVDVGRRNAIQVATLPRTLRHGDVFGRDNPTGWKHDPDDTETAVTAHLFHLGR